MDIPLLIGAFTILILGIIGTPLLQVFLALKPYRVELDNQPEDHSMEYKNIEFKGTEGTKLRGWFIPAEEETNETVVVCHGHGFNRGKVLPKTHYLQEKYNLFLYDLRYFGKSDGEFTTFGKKESKDLEKAAEFLKEKTKTKKVAVIGYSMSAATVLMADHSEIDAVVADSPFADLELLAERVYMYLPGKTKKPFIELLDYFSQKIYSFSLKDIRPEKISENKDTPTLLIHGENDFQIPSLHSERINSRLKNSELWKVEGAGHVRSYEKQPEKYQEKVENFLKKNF